MLLRPASKDEISDLARIVVGERSQPSTDALMRLFELDDLHDVIEMTQIMIASTGAWTSMTVAEIDGHGAVGLVQAGDPFAAVTPEVAEFARRLYGESFREILGPRLVAMGAVQATYPPGCLLIAEIHTATEHRGKGIGRSLIEHVVRRAQAEDTHLLGLQTLTTNPARQVFESWGFEVADTQTDPSFEAFTGASGYHTMLREV